MICCVRHRWRRLHFTSERASVDGLVYCVIDKERTVHGIKVTPLRLPDTAPGARA